MANASPLHADRDSAAQSSELQDDKPENAGPAKIKIETNTAQNRPGHVNASPEDANITPGTMPPQ